MENKEMTRENGWIYTGKGAGRQRLPGISRCQRAEKISGNRLPTQSRGSLKKNAHLSSFTSG